MKVVWTITALADLDAIHAYIARDSAYYASRFAGRMVRAVRILAAIHARRDLGSMEPKPWDVS